MELLISSGVVILTYLIRWVWKKTGKELGTAIVYIGLFVLTFIGTFVAFRLKANISDVLWREWLNLFGQQMVIYELIVKRLIFPAIAPPQQV